MLRLVALDDRGEGLLLLLVVVLLLIARFRLQRHRTDDSSIEEAEGELLECGLDWFNAVSKGVHGSCRRSASNVRIPRGCLIHQVQYHSSTTDRLEAPPLVALHGFGSGVGIWYRALPALAAQWPGPVLALDWFGCGMSTRPPWSLGHGTAGNPDDVEAFFVLPLEEWRVAAKIERMVLLGHSMGGYLAGCYALRFPDRVPLSHCVKRSRWVVWSFRCTSSF